MPQPESDLVRSDSPADAVSVTPVADKAGIALFISLPRRLYAGLAGFVPPLDLEQADLLHPAKSAFYRHASVQMFIAWRSGAPVGRICAQVDFVAQSQDADAPGYFGALDAIDDRAVVHALLDAAQDWLRAQGMRGMRGPLTPSPNGESGLMIEGQSEPAMIAMPWHPVWLADHVAAFGFDETNDLLSYRMPLDGTTEMAHAVPDGMKPGQGALRNIAIKSLSKKEIAQQGEVLRTLYNDAWKNTWNFVPLQSYEIESMIKQLAPLLRSEHYVQIEQNGVPVAMALVVPNLYDIAGDLGGAPSPFGWARLGIRLLRHRFTSARVILLGVSSRLQGTLLGALMPGVAIAELFQRGHSLPYNHVDLGWIREHDMPMRRLIERIAPLPNKRYRVYERAIERPAPDTGP